MKNVVFVLFLLTNILLIRVNAQNVTGVGNDPFENSNNGELICSDTGKLIGGSIRKSQQPYDAFIMGVFQKTNTESTTVSAMFAKLPILKEGVCSVKYNSENGPIKKGDILTSSSTPGEAMKATKSGMMVGIALEDASSVSGLVKIRILIQYVKQ